MARVAPCRVPSMNEAQSVGPASNRTSAAAMAQSRQHIQTPSLARASASPK